MTSHFNGAPRVAAALALGVLLAACSSKPDAPPTPPVVTTEFDGEAALKYAAAQVAFGPRVPGSEGHRKAGDWIAAQMKARGAIVIEQTWTHTAKDGKKLPLRNILARFNPQAAERVLYLTHWDTRPVADSDPEPANQLLPIDGANDAASGVGLFVALADALQKKPSAFGVDLLFVDGEDYGDFGPPLVDVSAHRHGRQLGGARSRRCPACLVEGRIDGTRGCLCPSLGQRHHRRPHPAARRGAQGHRCH
ncbi:MAG: M28 family peptidase [Gemmatimonadetes bacterium]|nr:M28 family peptidase [Gemmatimonadota bacterium]